jgi:hypothetical protein
MKKILLIIYLIIFNLTLNAQKDTSFIAITPPEKYMQGESANFNLNIYPVPVRDNSFTIRTDKDISFIKVTNIIGQDVYRIKYNNPQQLIKVVLDNPKRGMYLVTIVFSDGLRVVKKIMIQESE